MTHVKNCHGVVDKQKQLTLEQTISKRLPIVSEVLVWAVRYDIPWNSIDNKQFRRFVPNTPSRSTLVNHMSEVYDGMLELVKETIRSRKIKHYAVSLDSWTDNYRRNNYIGIQLYSLNERFEMEHVRLHCLDKYVRFNNQLFNFCSVSFGV
jgi:hypothetical protein